jgi:hypothetical protein
MEHSPSLKAKAYQRSVHFMETKVYYRVHQQPSIYPYPQPD